MDTKHTKGKWELEIVDDQLRIYSGKQCICVMSIPKYTNREDYEEAKNEALANARHICQSVNNYKK